MPVLCTEPFQALTLFNDLIFSQPPVLLHSVHPQLAKPNFLFPVAATPFSVQQSDTAITTYLTPYKIVLSYKPPPPPPPPDSFLSSTTLCLWFT